MKTFSKHVLGVVGKKSQKNRSDWKGRDTGTRRGGYAKNKDHLGSDQDRTMSAKPSGTRDEFGSRHNQDQRTAAQIRMGRQNGHGYDPTFRETSQDVRTRRGRGNTEQYRAKKKNRSRKPPARIALVPP